MGKWGSYTEAVKAKLADLFLVKQTNNGDTDTYSVTTEQIGETVNGEQTYSDLISTDKTIVGAINEIGSLPDSAQGSIATFTTSLEKPLVACEVDQNATTVYHRGVNQWNEETELGTINTTTGQDSSATNRLRSVGYTPVSPNTNYYCVNNGAGNVYGFFYDANKTFISSAGITNTSFTTPSNATFMRMSSTSAYGTTYNNDISINYPSTNNTYKAYNTNSGDYAVADVSQIETFNNEVNNIFADVGTVDVTYLETIKEYIDKRVTP